MVKDLKVKFLFGARNPLFLGMRRFRFSSEAS